MHRESRALQEILPKESVCVFVGAALPGTLGIAEIHQGVRCQGEGLLVRQFHTSIPRQRLAELFGQRPDVRAEGRHHGLGALAADFDEHRKSGVPLDERRDVSIVTSGNEVALPMSENGSVCDLRGAIGNRDPVDNVATTQSSDIAMSRLTEYALGS